MIGAHALILAALQAMGGRQRLLAVHSVNLTAVGTRQMVEQSERPTGPYFIDQFTLTQSVDLQREALRARRQDWGYAGPSWWLNQREPLSTDVLADGGIAGSYDGKSWSYAGRSPVQFAEERIAFGPERVLDRKSTRLNSSHVAISYA